MRALSLLDRVLGKPLASGVEGEQRVGVVAGVPLLGLDALSSAAYGPEAALTVLLPVGTAGLAFVAPIMAVILALLTILYLSYRQIIAAYPKGGGAYTVAKINLGERAGLLAGAALLTDYILNVAVGISAGVGALVSAVPSLLEYRLDLCLAILLLVAIVNLRGVRESGIAFALPTYLFVGMLGYVLVIGLLRALASGGHPTPVLAPPAPAATTQAVTVWLLLRSFASGCTAMTGVEAVSNGVGAFAAPSAARAQRTLTVIVALLAALLIGITLLIHAYGVTATDPEGKGYQSVLSMLTAATVGRGTVYYVTLGAVLAVLALSANTSYAGFPRLCRLIAEDDYLPHSFANRGRRLVYSMGITVLSVIAALLLIGFRGVTDRLIPLFAVGAFLAFTLSQAGMVVHWRRAGQDAATFLRLTVNAVGAVATGAALVVVLAAKFAEGAWVTLLLIPSLLMLFYKVREHYDYVVRATACAKPVDATARKPPFVVVPVKRWDAITRNALNFALRLSNDIVGVHIHTEVEGCDESAETLREEWRRFVDEPLRAAGRTVPELVVVRSPYRRLFTPLMHEVLDLKREHPDRQIAVLIPELVEAKWYEYLLHNQRATGLKAALLLRGGKRIVVVNVPWYLGEEGK
jgi:amino acid transporter